MTEPKRTRRGHHEGTSYQRPDGLWQWRATFPDGRRRSFYGKTRREAKRKADDALRDFESGLTARSERMTMQAYLSHWLEDTAASRVRPSTLESYRSHIDHHIVPALGTIRLRDLSATDVNHMLASIVRSGVSPTTANRVRATLRTALTSAVKSGMILRNAATLSDARKERRHRITPLTAEQARQLIQATRDDRLGPLIAVALATGMRQGELLALRWSDIDLENRVIHVHRTLTWRKGGPDDDRKMIPVFSDPKTEQSRRSIRLTHSAIEALHRQRAQLIEMEQAATVANWKPIPGEDLVFPSSHGTPQSGPNVTHRLHALLEDAGLPQQRFHDLRHATASMLLAEGVDLFTVKEILGHSQISLTANTYGHLTDKLADDAATRLNRALGYAKTETSAPKGAPDPIDSDVQKRMRGSDTSHEYAGTTDFLDSP